MQKVMMGLGAVALMCQLAHPFTLVSYTAEVTPTSAVIESIPQVVNTGLEVIEQPWTDEEVEVLAKMLWGETRGVKSDTQIAGCVWCVLNRVDTYKSTITDIVTAPGQFVGYSTRHPVDEHLVEIATDVLSRWYAEKDGETNSGRVLPPDYLWFSGDGQRNYFRNRYTGGQIWDWSLNSPYES